MKRIWFGKKNRSDNLLHIETEGCIVNIRVNLRDRFNRDVTSIEIIPDKCPNSFWKVLGNQNNRVVKLKKMD